ncbi:MAG: hypothetical protein HQM04_13360 [Magnetococcales bacterium]|nr:hypothetical protein [Magnetococcales bacterium]MBF0116013.1 hypothetical protein [Magnetococcales bacterium]
MSEPTVLELFAQESQRRILQGLDDVRGLLAKDQGAQRTILEEFLRTCRGVRGAASFHDLGTVSRLSQTLEQVLESLLDHQERLDGGAIDSLEQGMGRLQELFMDVAASNTILVDDVIDNLDGQLSAWSQPVPIPFDLQHYPQEVAEALLHQLQFYSLELHLTGSRTAKREFVSHLKEVVSVVGAIIDSVPRLGEDLDIGENFTGKTLHLLFATVLQPDLLVALTQLSAHQIQHLPVPEEMIVVHKSSSEDSVSTALIEASNRPSLDSDLFAEAQLGELEAKFREEALNALRDENRESGIEETATLPVETPSPEPSPEQNEEEEPFLLVGLEMAPSEVPLQPEEVVEPIRLVVDEADWDKWGESSSLPDPAQFPPDICVKELPVKEESSGRWRLLVGTALAAGVCALLYLNWPKAPPEKSQELLAALPTQSTSQTSVPVPSLSVAPQPDKAPEKMATPSSEPALAAATAATVVPVESFGKEGKVNTVPVESKLNASMSLNLAKRAAVSEKGDGAQSTEKEVTASPRPQPKPGLEPYTHTLTAIDRLRHAPFQKLVPPKGKPQNTILIDRHAEGGMVFSMVPLLGHMAKRPGEEFVLQTETIQELRVVFQIDLGEAYLFSFDDAGKLILPADFWDNFYRYSRRAITLSRVVRAGEKGLQIRDIVAVSADMINRHAGKNKSHDRNAH